MHSRLNDWKNGWFGVEFALVRAEIERVISQLQMLKEEPGPHIHLSSDNKGTRGLGDIEISVQSPNEPGNRRTTGKALGPGRTIPDPVPAIRPSPGARCDGAEL